MRSLMLWYGLAAAALAILLAACAGEAGPGPVGPGVEVARAEAERDAAPAVPEGDVAELVEGNNRFAFDLYRALRQDDSGNLMVSPYSISQALAMVYAGARGDTSQQMADTLHFLLPQDSLHPAFNALDLNLTTREYDTFEGEEGQQLELNIANAIWGQKDYEFLPDYLDVIARNYGAGLRLVDFVAAPEEARVTINDWVSQETEERIQDLIPPGLINAATRLVLTNAIYFNASWLHPFEESATHDEAFYLLDGSQVTVPMMSQQEDFAYARVGNVQAVELPYFGHDMAMLVMLPDEGEFEAFESTLDAARFAEIRAALRSEEVILHMPRFTYEYEASLSSKLAAMGMPIAFTAGEADFSGIDGTRDLFISEVVHKTFVAVDESGTEAAAATAVLMELAAAMPEAQPLELWIDHPFIFAIYDQQTGSKLFVGCVLNPAQ